MYSGLLAPKGVSNQERRIARGDKQFNDRVRDSLIIGCDAKREPEETSTTICFQTLGALIVTYRANIVGGCVYNKL